MTYRDFEAELPDAPKLDGFTTAGDSANGSIGGILE
jgi:hypothetical protein